MNKKFNKNMDKILLENGFKYWDDWEYGPMCGWSESWDRPNLKLMRHDSGYWIIFKRHYGDGMNIGSSNDAHQIIKLRNELKKVSDWPQK